MPNMEHGPATPFLQQSDLITRAPSTAAAERMSHNQSPVAGCFVFKLRIRRCENVNKRTRSNAHLQQRLPSARIELKCVIDNSDRGQAKTRTLSPILADALADKNDATEAASLIMHCNCLSAGALELQCSAASIHEAASCRQVYGAKPPEHELG